MARSAPAVPLPPCLARGRVPAQTRPGPEDVEGQLALSSGRTDALGEGNKVYALSGHIAASEVV